jgi:hypothetical protein
MKVKDKASRAWVSEADLVLEGAADVELLKRALAAYDRFVTDHDAPYVIPLPLSQEAGPSPQPDASL